ncbi:magnesium and cobalt efflux protein CorC [Clostridium acetireducens DSM 10703]|uniref:Magnesium and cobalt efflux protein CorC n=1 Tax=Clostridium acetireducens DSM 10703 TaxID=1121290 RepID=A0A1E8F1T2_9CLOT|nr:hemolysin family protein [Clostridium acetireducens]OFI07154.1 magnesium and cobalt efflux protein CorC [Clostridium acetireducens DSM 10703]
MENNIVLEIILILILILINAFFAASEMAIVSLNKSKINNLSEKGDKSAKNLLKLLKEPSKFLATIQVGITLAGFLASASAATTISKPVAHAFHKFKIPAASKISLIIVTIMLSYITLVFGELFPKRVALQNSEKIALASVKPILFFSKLLRPFVNVLTSSTNLLLRIFGINIENLDEKVSEEEIRMMIDAGEEIGVINQIEKEMIDSIFEFDDTLAKEIMTPRPNVFAIDVNISIDEVINKVVEEKYSRIPVYEGEIDNIIGVLYMKDLFVEVKRKNLTKETLKSILRPAYFVPETKNIDELFKKIQKTKNHIAILIDEYGSFSGIVTIEDLIEEIVGNIFDEYDEINEYIKKIDNNTYLVDGLLSIDELNERLNLNLPTENFDTIGGFVIDLLGSIPENNEDEIVYENLKFKIESAEEKRIKKLTISVLS